MKPKGSEVSDFRRSVTEAFFGLLRDVGWYLVTDVSRQPLGPNLKAETFLDCLTFQDGLHIISWNVGNQLTT
jgi:hypothetical protein